MANPTFKVQVVVCSHRDIKLSVLASLWPLRDCPDPKIEIEFQDGDALISRSRSIRATKFLKSNADLLCFIDDDVVISAFDLTKLMWLAWQQKYDVIGAAYTLKSKENPGFAIRPLTDGITMHYGKNGGIYEVKYVSTGCVVIRRDVLEKMVETETIHDCEHGTRRYYPFFQHREMEVDGKWEDLSEDWFFCEMARRLGYKIFVDTTVKTGHIGPYEFNWDDVIEARNGLRKTYDDIAFRILPISAPALNGREAARLKE